MCILFRNQEEEQHFLLATQLRKPVRQSLEQRGGDIPAICNPGIPEKCLSQFFDKVRQGLLCSELPYRLQGQL